MGQIDRTPQAAVAMDPDVQRVLEFMVRGMSADKLVPVAAAVARIAPILWDRYENAELIPLDLEWPAPA